MHSLKTVILSLCFFCFGLRAQTFPINGLIENIRSNPKDTASIITLNNYLIELYNAGLSDSAIYYSEKVIPAYRTENIHMARTFNILGNCYSLKGAYSIVLKNYLRALEIYEKFDYKKGIGNCYNNIGNTYKVHGYYDEALSYLNKALQIRLQQGDSANIALTYNNIANNYHSKKEYEKAILYHNKSLKIKEILSDTFSIIVSLNNIGGLYADIMDCSKSKEYLMRSNKLIGLIGGNSQDYGLNYANLSRANNVCKDYAEAIKWGQKAIVAADEFNDAETKLDAYHQLYKAYWGKGDKNNALYYLQEYLGLKDSLFNSENTKKLLTEQSEYQYNKKAELEKLEQIKKDAQTKAEKEKQQQRFFMLSVILAITILLALFIYRNYLQKQKVNQHITIQNSLIKQKQKEILDSINYAQRIQSAILPDTDHFIENFREAFVLYIPKDIVSGDLYWFAKLSTTTANPIHLKVIAVADCTGHGVPGAFMSMLSVQLLNESIKNPNINSPGELLVYMNQRITTILNSNNKQKVNDGLDIAVCAFDYSKNTAYYSGANRPLWVLREGLITEYKATKAAIGGLTDLHQHFETISIPLNEGDKVFLFTDGITDQFGGPNNKKFTKTKLKKLVEQTANLPLRSQQEELKKALLDWRGTEEQTDDILILAFTV